MPILLQKGEALKELLNTLSIGGDTATLIMTLFKPVCVYDSVQKLMDDLQNPANTALRTRFNQLIAEPTFAALFRGYTNMPAGQVVSTQCVNGDTVAYLSKGDGTTDTVVMVAGYCAP